MCSCHLAPLSATIHTYTGNSVSAPHSLQQLQNGDDRQLLCSHLLHIQEANGAASSGFVFSSLLPCSAISSQVPACPSRNVTGDVMPLAEAITQLSFLEFLQTLRRPDCSSPAASATSPHLTPGCCCAGRLHLVTPFRMCPRRRLISRSPRYFSTWQCRRLPTVSTPHLWMLPCRRSHTVLCLSTFLHRWVLAQLPRFLLICLFRLPYAVRCYTMLPYNYRSRSSLLAVSSRTILWTAKTLFVSPRHQYKMILVVAHHL